MAEEKRCARQLTDIKANVEKYDGLARKALAAGNEGDAKVFIAKKQEFEATLSTAQKTYDVALANAEKMQQMHDKLVSDINSLKARRDNVKATMTVAKTQDKVNDAQAAFDGASGSLAGFPVWSRKHSRCWT